MRLAGKQLKYSQYLVIVHDRHHYDGRNAQLPAHIAIHAGIPLGIVAAQRFASPDALSRQSKLCGKKRTQFRSVRSGARPAEHVASPAAPQRNRCPAGASDELGPVREQLQCSVQIPLRHIGEGSSPVFARKTYRGHWLRPWVSDCGILLQCRASLAVSLVTNALSITSPRTGANPKVRNQSSHWKNKGRL